MRSQIRLTLRRGTEESRPGERVVNITPATIPLLEAFERNEGCVLCYLWLNDEFQSMEFVEDNEVSMDEAFRRDVVASSGFCNRHMHVLHRVVFSGGIPDGLGYAMYAEDTVEMLHGSIQAIQTAFHESRKKSWNVLSKERTPRAVIESAAEKLEEMLKGTRICEICRRMLLADARRTRTLLEMLGHQDFAGRFASSGRLCFPHFVTSMQMLPTRRVGRQAVAALLVETELRCLRGVDDLLSQGGKASLEMAAMMIAGVEGLYCVTKKGPNPLTMGGDGPTQTRSEPSR
jgi:hypothetical protein